MRLPRPEISPVGIYRPWTPQIEAGQVLQSDSLGYHRLAIRLVENHTFDLNATAQPEALRTRLYPLYIAGFYALFGYKPWIVILSQTLLDMLACGLLFMSLEILFGRRVGLIAAAFYALEPSLILYASTTLLSDSLFIFFLVLAFYFLSRGRWMENPKKSLVSYGLSGFSLGFACLVRPVGEYVIFCLVLFLLMAYWKKPGLAIRYILVSAILFIVPPLPLAD